MKRAEAEFNKAMNALFLEMDESIVKDVRQKAENYVKEQRIDQLNELVNMMQEYSDKYPKRLNGGVVSQLRRFVLDIIQIKNT